jgi:hypothetical protein
LGEWFKELKQGLSCGRCPEDHVACLEFHHLDPMKKDLCVGYMARKGYSKQRILEEIKKCEVLYSNCHRKEHFNEEGTKK